MLEVDAPKSVYPKQGFRIQGSGCREEPADMTLTPAPNQATPVDQCRTWSRMNFLADMPQSPIVIALVIANPVPRAAGEGSAITSAITIGETSPEIAYNAKSRFHSLI